MAGWDILQQEYRRGAPVEPQIPKFDPTAVQLISHGTDTAVRALLGGIELGQRNRLEKEKMAQDLALTTEGHMIQRENNVLDYNLGRGNLDVSRESHRIMNELHMAQTELTREKIGQIKGAIGMGYDFQHSVAAYSEDFRKRWDQLGGNNAAVLGSPILAALAIDIAGKEFSGAIPATGIPDQLGGLQAQNDKQQIVLNWNGEDKFFKPREVLGLLQNETTREKALEALKAQPGYGEEREVETKNILNKVPFLGALISDTQLKRMPTEKLKALEDAVKRVHPELIKRRIPFTPRTEKTFNAGVRSGRVDPRVTPQDQSAAGVEPDIIPDAVIPDATPAPLVAPKDQAWLRATNIINEELQKPNPDQAKIQRTRDWFKRDYGEDLER